jgi:hypothetical protein
MRLQPPYDASRRSYSGAWQTAVRHELLLADDYAIGAGCVHALSRAAMCGAWHWDLIKSPRWAHATDKCTGVWLNVVLLLVPLQAGQR